MDTSRKQPLGALAAVTAAATAALALAAAPASAAPSEWTVGPASPAAFTALSEDTVLSVNGFQVTCPTAAAAGELFDATGNPAHVGDIAEASFGTESQPCASPVGSVTPIADTDPAWRVQAVTHQAETGVTTGFIEGISAHLSIVTCDFDVTGEVAVTYDNATGTLSISNDDTRLLTVSNATPGCIALVEDGDHPTFTGSYVLDADGQHPTITGA
ncbi:hypothetical protein [Streptomyces sp. MUM 178J]|uniref:hypothetical protein n=1 Tax=Streptomyces sp. MUM 178J TaxID=2791991 RepID=UPI001F04287B|nr:hypothetical protein [Streptomyces sp. MUM 178J]WRQ80068.1 hypothetical protein I3F59_012300 [Streptomyces sp. MUM 178J]